MTILAVSLSLSLEYKFLNNFNENKKLEIFIVPPHGLPKTIFLRVVATDLRYIKTDIP
jgi:hypothetical protein